MVAFGQNTNTTQVWEKIQEKILGLCVTKKGREITLIIDDEAEQALYAACMWSSEEHDQVFSKTARAIRIRLHEKEECFDEDVSIERLVQSVPDILIKFISMILEGGDFNQSLSTILDKISTNIAQLITFNSVKRKRSDKITKLLPLNKKWSPFAGIGWTKGPCQNWKE